MHHFALARARKPSVGERSCSSPVRTSQPEPCDRIRCRPVQTATEPAWHMLTRFGNTCPLRELASSKGSLGGTLPSVATDPLRIPKLEQGIDEANSARRARFATGPAQRPVREAPKKSCRGASSTRSQTIYRATVGMRAERLLPFQFRQQLECGYSGPVVSLPSPSGSSCHQYERLL